MSRLEKESIKVMARNREAYHEYFVEEEMEAGIALSGTEVKSIRAGTLNLKDAWCGIKDGELLLNQMHISPYDHGNIFNRDPRRPRKLLMHKREIMRLYGKVKQDGYALIPLTVYFKGSRVISAVISGQSPRLQAAKAIGTEALLAMTQAGFMSSTTSSSLGAKPYFAMICSRGQELGFRSSSGRSQP